MIDGLLKKGLYHGKIVSIQPTPRGKIVPLLNKQQGLFTLIERGKLNGTDINQSTLISSIQRGINPYEEWDQVLALARSADIQLLVSNTTEAGITYEQEPFDPSISPLSYPGKVTAFLYHRYRHFSGSSEAGLIVVPLELIENNGQQLKEIVLQLAIDWRLPESFSLWIEEEIDFCNTLVDRIVTGYPDQPDVFQLPYNDVLLTVSEPYHFFAIESRTAIETILPLQKAGFNVAYGHVAEYRTLKIRILNGAHTTLAAPSLLCGLSTVKEAMAHPLLQVFVEQALVRDILPSIDQDDERKHRFAQETLERFANPYTEHQFSAIAMHSLSKWEARVWPSVSEQSNDHLALSLAALLLFYRTVAKAEDGSWYVTIHNKKIAIRDNEQALENLQAEWQKQVPITTIISALLEADWLFPTISDFPTSFKKSIIHLSGLIEANGIVATLEKTIEPIST
ncbi:altronate oxidoreductase [Bacillus sp. JCM 19045]|nr:altronate oxidoreductase [Bacillus sp. JCM 19045]